MRHPPSEMRGPSHQLNYSISQPMNFNKYTICSPSVWEFNHLVGSGIILRQLPMSLSPLIQLRWAALYTALSIHRTVSEAGTQGEKTTLHEKGAGGRGMRERTFNRWKTIDSPMSWVAGLSRLQVCLEVLGLSK